jgi:hypothetical protein
MYDIFIHRTSTELFAYETYQRINIELIERIISVFCQWDRDDSNNDKEHERLMNKKTRLHGSS